MLTRLALPIFTITLAVAVGVADDAPKVKLLPLPPDPVVPAKPPLAPKAFTQALPGTEIKFDMVYVPGGTFTMGSPDDEPGRDLNEGPQHQVAVRPFWLAKCEVTWEQYYGFWKDENLRVFGETKEDLTPQAKPDAITRPTNTYVDELYEHGRDGHPAICMSHHGAMMFCHYLRHVTKLPYRLPTEAEWEYACRAGQSGPYGFAGGEAALGEHAWFLGNSATNKDADENAQKVMDEQPTTHIVGRKKANAFGLHDMHGNVAEWVLDRYDPGFYQKCSLEKLSAGPVVVPGAEKWGHIVRGGSWNDKPAKLRAAARIVSEIPWMKNDPQSPRSIWWLTKKDTIGFRVALPTDEYPALIGLKPMVVKANQPE